MSLDETEAGKRLYSSWLRQWNNRIAGRIHFKKGSKIGYLSQIPLFEQPMTGYDVLHSAFAELKAIQRKLSELEMELSNPDRKTWISLLHIYGQLQDEFVRRDGYAMDSEIEKSLTDFN